MIKTSENDELGLISRDGRDSVKRRGKKVGCDAIRGRAADAPLLTYKFGEGNGQGAVRMWGGRPNNGGVVQISGLQQSAAPLPALQLGNSGTPVKRDLLY